MRYRSRFVGLCYKNGSFVSSGRIETARQQSRGDHRTSQGNRVKEFRPIHSRRHGMKSCQVGQERTDSALNIPFEVGPPQLLGFR